MRKGPEDMTANGRYECLTAQDTISSATNVSVEGSLVKHPTDRETTPMPSTDERTVPYALCHPHGSARSVLMNTAQQRHLCDHGAAAKKWSGNLQSFNEARRHCTVIRQRLEDTGLKIEVLADPMWRAASLQDMLSADLLKPCSAGLVAAIRETGRLLYHSANRARPVRGEDLPDQ